MKKTDDCICFDGEILEGKAPVAGVDSRGLMYGEGVFDTLRTYSGQTLFFSEHIDRLQSGLKALGIDLAADFTADCLRSQIQALLAEKQLLNTAATVRLQAWRDGSRGYAPGRNETLHYTITASACPGRFEFPALATVDRRRIPSQALPSEYKFTNGINYILAAREARKKGADDALMQTIDGWISETTIANIFWRRGDCVYTPGRDCDLLPGITRKMVIELIRAEEQLKLITGTFELEHLLQADEIWICNSVRELLAVKTINGKPFTTEGEGTTILRKRFEKYRNEHLKAL